jgi:hypothetical protein
MYSIIAQLSLYIYALYIYFEDDYNLTTSLTYVGMMEANDTREETTQANRGNSKIKISLEA